MYVTLAGAASGPTSPLAFPSANGEMGDKNGERVEGEGGNEDVEEGKVDVGGGNGEE